MNLHTETFYGLRFEPYFHSRVTEQGYSGKMRMLQGVTDAVFINVKRNVIGMKKKTAYTIATYAIPALEMNIFHYIRGIHDKRYNVPDRKNFAAVDSLCPSRGEMFQVTSAHSHPVKAVHLKSLKSKFGEFLTTGKKVKLIFVVPPSRFEDFGLQEYLQPEPLRDTKTRELIPVEKIIIDWVDQYVLEMDVSPLRETFNERAEEELTKNIVEKIKKGLLKAG
jgi:hypothetical protein